MKESSVSASAASPAAAGTVVTAVEFGPFELLALVLPAVVAFCGAGTKDIHLIGGVGFGGLLLLWHSCAICGNGEAGEEMIEERIRTDGRADRIC